MSFLIALGFTLLLAPLFIPLVLKFLVRVFGHYLIQKTRGRRELLLSKATENIEPKTGLSKDLIGEDADWEKVARNIPASAPNGDKFDGSWHGIVGFFHPFW
jgi:hypothetical protein